MEKIPWLALPFKDKAPKKLIYYFDTNKYPTLVIIGPDGKILNSNAINSLTNMVQKLILLHPRGLMSSQRSTK